MNPDALFDAVLSGALVALFLAVCMVRIQLLRARRRRRFLRAFDRWVM